MLMFSVCTLTPTPAQSDLLAGPLGNVDALKAADFLGKQDYIDKWIRHWLISSENVPLLKLPLCVENSIRCDKTLQRIFKMHIRHAILNNNIDYVKAHYIVETGPWHWNIVDLFKASDEMMEFLWKVCPPEFELAPFIVEARRYPLWTAFVTKYGPERCLHDAVAQHWFMGVRLCTDNCTDIPSGEIKSALTHERIFRLLIQFDVLPNDDLWEEFILQRLMGRTSHCVEEWFWINGYK